MNRFLVFLAAVTMTSLGYAQDSSTSGDLARGGMHFSAKAMDANHDGMISKDEFMKYHSDMWDSMTKDSKGTMTMSDAKSAFARGGMHINADKMDADHDGNITKDEFMSYESTHWSLLPKDSSGQISVADMEKAMKKHRAHTPAADAPAASKSDSGN